MKKIILFLIVMVACISCSDNYMLKDKCYKCNYTMPTGQSVETYQWMSKHDIECQKALFTDYKYTDVKYTRASKYKTIEDCIAQDTCKAYGVLAK